MLVNDPSGDVEMRCCNRRETHRLRFGQRHGRGFVVAVWRGATGVDKGVEAAEQGRRFGVRYRARDARMLPDAEFVDASLQRRNQVGIGGFASHDEAHVGAIGQGQRKSLKSVHMALFCGKRGELDQA